MCMGCINKDVLKNFKVMHSDPGIVPINKENQNNTIIELCEKDEMDSTTICTESMMKRPLRSKYDRFSKKLIAKFDHYCPWVNNAVGAGNHKVSKSSKGRLRNNLKGQSG